jgi:hypothetical protein
MTDTNVDAHMPPQAVPADDDPVWANEWNPDTNEWAPSSEQHSVFGVAEPSHGDEPHAMPEADYPGGPSDGGTVPDARLNLADTLRGKGPVPAPVARIEHVVTTEEVAATIVRARIVAVVGNATPTVLLDEAPNRKRALIHVITAASQILVYPARQGGIPALVAAPTTGGAFWFQATGDAHLEVKAQAAVEAVGITAGGTVLVAIWEELNTLHPGIGV